MAKKNKSFLIRISNLELELLEKNLPPEVSSISELFRTAALKAAQSPEFLKQHVTDINLEGVNEKITESEDKIIFEIQQNRALITAIQKVVQQQYQEESEKLKDQMISDLTTFYIEHHNTIKTYDDLFSIVEDPFLQQVINDTIKTLTRKSILQIKPNGKVIWYQE
jgi:Fe2+ transport system protein B